MEKKLGVKKNTAKKPEVKKAAAKKPIAKKAIIKELDTKKTDENKEKKLRALRVGAGMFIINIVSIVVFGMASYLMYSVLINNYGVANYLMINGMINSSNNVNKGSKDDNSNVGNSLETGKLTDSEKIAYNIKLNGMQFKNAFLDLAIYHNGYEDEMQEIELNTDLFATDFSKYRFVMVYMIIGDLETSDGYELEKFDTRYERPGLQFQDTYVEKEYFNSQVERFFGSKINWANLDSEYYNDNEVVGHYYELEYDSEKLFLRITNLVYDDISDAYTAKIDLVRDVTLALEDSAVLNYAASDIVGKYDYVFRESGGEAKIISLTYRGR